MWPCPSGLSRWGCCCPALRFTWSDHEGQKSLGIQPGNLDSSSTLPTTGQMQVAHVPRPWFLGLLKQQAKRGWTPPSSSSQRPWGSRKWTCSYFCSISFFYIHYYFIYVLPCSIKELSTTELYRNFIDTKKCLRIMMILSTKSI